MKKLSNPMMHLIVLLLVHFCMLILAGVLCMLIGACFAEPGGRASVLCEQVVGTVLMFAVPAVVVVWCYYGEEACTFIRADFGGQKWLLAAVAAGVVLLSVPLMDWVGVWNDGVSFGRMDGFLRRQQEASEALTQKMLASSSVWGLVANLVVMALVPAVCEELFFRVGIQNLLQRSTKSEALAVWLTAAAFSLWHFELYAFLPRMFMGAILGYVYVRGRSVLPNMAAHFANNAAVVLLSWLFERGTIGIDPSQPFRIGWLPTAVCSIAALGFYILFFRTTKKDAVGSEGQ